MVSEQGAAGLARTRTGRPVAVPQYNGGASVSQLVLINRSKRPLLLLAGELVSGGKQDRIIGKDWIMPGGAYCVPLDVFCVEHGPPGCASKPRSIKSRRKCGPRWPAAPRLCLQRNPHLRRASTAACYRRPSP